MKFRSVFASGALALSLAAASALTATPAQAIGCLSGAVAGGVAGHYAGHHGVIGAIGGCIAGHHLHKQQMRERAARRDAYRRQSAHSY